MTSGIFKATSVQALNINTYLTAIGLELDKKVDQTAVQPFSGLFYSTITKNRSIHQRRLTTPLEILEKRYTKLLGSTISELEKRHAYITAP